MNRRLCKPFFSNYLKVKLTKIVQQNVNKINPIPMDNVEKVIQYDNDKTETILKAKKVEENKNVKSCLKKHDFERKSRYFSTNSFQKSCKELKFLREKIETISQKNLLRYYSYVPTFHIGDEANLEKRITEEDIQKFIELSGDSNPIHYSQKDQRGIVHGAFLNSLVSNVIGTKLPGPGTVVTKQTLNFPNRCYVGEVVRVNVKVTQDRKIVKVEFSCRVEDGEGPGKVVLFGEAQLIHKGTGKEEQMKPRGL